MDPRVDSESTAWAARLISELNASDLHAKGLVEGLTPGQLNWRPSPEAWSIGQCLDHLRVTNEVYLPAISEALAGRPIVPVQDITPGWFGRWFIRSFIEPSSKSKKVRAPKQIAPVNQVDPAVLEHFLASNQATRALVRRASNYDVNQVRFKNPFIPLVRFTVGTGLEIVSRHQRRHLLQAERVRQAVEFPGAR